jgi:predicted ATPase/class 3 adenylate cyclase/Tfp pilus assembly protein PilF
MPPLPTGTVTLFFTDMEGSTPLLVQLGDAAYNTLRDDFYRILRSTCDAYGGQEVEDHGDGTHVAFQSAPDAARAATDVLRAMRAHTWPDGVEVRLRIGLHTGTPLVTQTRYVGLDVHRAARICQAAWGGQILLTEEARDALASSLPSGCSLKDLGPHRLRGLQRAEHVFQLVHDALPAEFPPVRSLDSLPNNLPRQVSAFVGREVEMARVKELVERSRLVTLTGAGGCGKTRLALQVAGDLVDAHRDGVWLVELAPLSDPALIAQEIASALRVREQQGRSLLATLIEYLEPRTLLIVLDNCEHLVQGCAEVADALLRACPNLRILTTSREPLAVNGEATYRVPSLSLPELDRMPGLERLAESEAVRLFVDRAASTTRFQLTSQNAPLVAHICQRLDGIPLAIELAAARVKVLSLDQIAVRLNDRFRLLTGGSRTAMPRQQTLRAAMDWSYALLSDAERRLLARLSVFAGSWRLDAAEAVCAGGVIDTGDVLDLVTQLVDKSLVALDESSAVERYRLLETVRQYSRDRLLEMREDDAYRRRHRDWHLTLAGEAESGLRGPRQSEWLERIDLDHDDIRAALDWCIANPREAEAGMRLAADMGRFWWMRGYLTEARNWLTALLAKASGAATLARSRALLEAGRLAWAQSDYTAATGFFDQSLAISRKLNDGEGTVDVLNMLGLDALTASEYPRARVLLDEALPLARAAGGAGGDRHRLAVLLNNLGLVYAAIGEYEHARALHRECLEIRRAGGDAHGAAISLNNLGLVAAATQDYDAAQKLYQESLDIHLRLGNKQHVMSTLNNLGHLALKTGDHDRASSLCDQSLTLARELADSEGLANAVLNLARVAARLGDRNRAGDLGRQSLIVRNGLRDRRGIAECLEHLAIVAAAGGLGDRAGRLYGAAAALRDKIGAPAAVADRDDPRSLALEEGAVARGRTLSLERAIEVALAEDA